MPFPLLPTFSPAAQSGSIVTTQNVRFSVLTSRLIRLEFSPEGQFEDRASQVFWNRDLPTPTFQKRATPRGLEIETEELLLSYQPRPSGFTRSGLAITLKRSGLTWHYSERDRGNLKGTARTLDGDYGTRRLENGLLSRDGWAVVNDAHSLVFNQEGWLEPRVREQKDLYFFGYGSDYAACLGDFTRLAGPIPMIPRYILGNWWSRYWEYTQAELQGLMQEFRARGIPLSVCIVDMDWHVTRTGNASNGWTGYTWNKALFPDPPGLIRWLHEQGLRTALNLHPASGIHPHEEQYPAMTAWMGMKADSGAPVVFDIADPHFTRGYFEILHHPHEKDGIDFWWLDWQQGNQTRTQGLDPLWWLNHLHYYDHGRDGLKRPFIFSRWGGLGNHRYPIGFSGDTFVRWRTLAYQPYFTATAANVGYGWWSHDIGGHMVKDGTPELYLRWVQFGVFSPIFRLHSTNKAGLDRRPWSKPEPYYLAAREAMRLRHALIPYLYSMAWRAHRTGLSLATPMYYQNPDREEAYAARDQYYFGTELMAAPVLQPADAQTGLAERRVWFPEGTWYNFFNGDSVKGEGWKTFHYRLEDIPVFARAGGIVPMGPDLGWGGTENPRELHLLVFPGGEGSFDLYEDDGETSAYLNNEYAVTRMQSTWTLGKLSFTIQAPRGRKDLIPAGRSYHIHLRGVPGDVGASRPGSYSAETRTYTLEPFQLDEGEAAAVEFWLPAVMFE